MTRDAFFARTEILWHLKNPPALHFGPPGFDTVRCVEPVLDRPPSVLAAFTAPKPIAERPVLNVFTQALAYGVKKLDYRDTTEAEWRRDFLFSGDRLITRGGGYAIENDVTGIPDYIVNSSRERAERWFREDLVSACILRPEHPTVYLVGEPGAGKSTLLKYLINTQRDFLETNKVVFSRFEFLKFLKFGSSALPLEKRRSNYVAFILLRDLLLSKAYAVRDGGKVQLTMHPKAVVKVVDEAFASFDPLHSHKAPTIDFLYAALQPNALLSAPLKKIAPDAAALLVNHLSQDRRLALVIDGLDCISLEDRQFDAQRYLALKHLMDNRHRLAHLSIGLGLPGEIDDAVALSVPLSTSNVLVMRENTFFLYEKGLRDDILSTETEMFRVQEIDPRAAIYNVLRRACFHWVTVLGGDPSREAEVLARLTRATFNALRFINRAVKTGEPSRYILGLFCGNMRTLFEFMENLLIWFVADSLRDGALKLGKTSTGWDVLDFITGSDGRGVLRRRSYRIVEILLFSGLPWFENRVRVKALSRYAEELGIGRGEVFQDNEHFSGVVDNVFNYHQRGHLPHPDNYPLLEKVRIVQLLKGQSLTSDALEEKLLHEFGYVSADIKISLTVLVRAQMIRTTLQGDIFLTATQRGAIVVDHLCRTMSYVEHVFHRTLFPDAMVRTIRDNSRTKDVDDWTAVSIRNVFVALTYLRATETNSARGHKVRKKYQFTDKLCLAVVKSVSRILADPAAGLGPVSTRQAARAAIRHDVAVKALRLIENILTEWEFHGVATPSRRLAARPLEDTDAERPQPV